LKRGKPILLLRRGPHGRRNKKKGSRSLLIGKRKEVLLSLLCPGKKDSLQTWGKKEEGDRRKSDPGKKGRKGGEISHKGSSFLF